jgi:hypothetical protein
LCVRGDFTRFPLLKGEGLNPHPMQLKITPELLSPLPCLLEARWVRPWGADALP